MKKVKINEDDIRRFFEDPFSTSYSRYCSETAVAAVAQINAALDFAMELLQPSKRKLMEDVVSAVAKQSAQLMRTAAVSRSLSDTEPVKELVDVDALIAYLCGQFTQNLGGRCRFRLRSVCHAYVESDIRIITELLLGAVRKMVLNRGKGDYLVYIGASVVGKKVRLYIADPHDDGKVFDPAKAKPCAKEEFFDRYFGEVSSVLAGLIGAEGGYSKGLYTIELPRFYPDNAAGLKSPMLCDSADYSYACEIMLNDDKL